MPRKTVVATHCHFTTFPAKYIKNSSLSAVLAGDPPVVALQKKGCLWCENVCSQAAGIPTGWPKGSWWATWQLHRCSFRLLTNGMRRMASVVLGFFHASSIVLPFENLVSVFDLESTHLDIISSSVSPLTSTSTSSFLPTANYSNDWTLTKRHFAVGAPRIETGGEGGNRPMPCVDLGADMDLRQKSMGSKRGMSRDDSSWNSSLMDFLVNKN